MQCFDSHTIPNVVQNKTDKYFLKRIKAVNENYQSKPQSMELMPKGKENARALRMAHQEDAKGKHWVSVILAPAGFLHDAGKDQGEEGTASSRFEFGRTGDKR